MNFTLHQLQVFRKVAELESITKAAEALHLSQPAVSIQLRNFQDQFEVPLTELVGRKLYITEFGKEMARMADRILAEVENIRHHTQSLQGRLSGRLQVSSVSTGKYLMPFLLSGFLKQHPEVELVLDVSNKSQVLEKLERNEIDFALISLMPNQMQLESISLMPNELLAVARATDLGEASPENWVATQPFIFRETGSATRQLAENYFREQGFPVQRKLELMSNEAVKQAVLAGLGWSIMPRIGIRQELESGELKSLSLPGLPITTNWNLVWRSGKKLSPVAEAYRQYLEDRPAAEILNF
jgi:DNA-binding transcriptional LysR family regulator